MRKRFLSVVISVVLLLSACGMQGGENQDVEGRSAEAQLVETGVSDSPNTSSGGEIRWTLKDTELPNADDALMEHLPEGGSCLERTCGMVGDAVYRVVTLRDSGLSVLGTCIQKLESPYSAWENIVVLRDEWVEGQYCYVAEAALGQDGSVYMLLQGVDVESNVHYYMGTWTEEVGCTIKELSNEYFTEEFLTGITGCYVDEAGTTYFMTYKGVQYFNSDFTEQKEWTNTGYVWQILESDSTEGQVYLCGSSIDYKARIWTTDRNDAVFSSDDVPMYGGAKVVFMNETDGFVCNSDEIWHFTGAFAQSESILSLVEQGYPVERICGAIINEDGNLLVLTAMKGEYLLLEMVEDTEWQDKVRLELATWYASPFLKEAIVNFNKQSEDCYIELRVPEEGETGGDFGTRILAEISSGGGPDLLNGDMIDWKAAAKKGYLRNLTEEFVDYKDDILDNVRAACEMDGVCYVVPHCFHVNAMVTSADYVGRKKSWTPEDVMKVVKANDAEAAFVLVDSADLYTLLAIHSELIDWDNGKSHLDSKEAIELLEFAKRYGDKGDLGESGIRLAEGKVIANYMTINGMDFPTTMEALFQGKETYIGFPVKKGENGNYLRAETFAINQACDCPEAAASFLEFLLTEENQEKLARTACESDTAGFPVCMEAFDNTFRYAEELAEDPYATALLSSYSGFEYLQEPISVASMEKVRKLLLNSAAESEDTSAVEIIISEEVQAYFSGNKSAKEVADAMHNRVQLYFDENR